MKEVKDTASFILRFTQEIYHDDSNEAVVRWKGHVRHIQGGEELKFSDFQDALTFLQQKMSALTLDSLQEETEEKQIGVLAKSFSFWKKMATDTPKLLMDTIKDPKGQVEHLQQQFQEFNESVNHRIETTIQNKIAPQEWRYATKSDFQQLLDEIRSLKEAVTDVQKKLDNG